ncbi:CMRF35-like molecule 3 [Polyodon spathula]|uniref:CMRF35-like molecule 3 n=1 Tax=Polyodon spathula TaxID=7913 RepID=UPI001B7E777A|nr:CMRF35-like molecule 3 [Polyodon spathula]
MNAIVEVAICLVAVLGCVKSAEGFTVNGIEGENVKIDCTYELQNLENKKYLCRDSWLTCKDVIRTGKPDTLVTDGRFSLYDKRSVRVFTVTIRRLTQEDAGIYWCGIDKLLKDKYTEVRVTVSKAPKRTTTTHGTRSSTTPSTTTVKGNTDNGQTGDYTPSSPAAPKRTITTRGTRSSTTPSTTTVKGNTDNGQTGDYTPSSPAGLEAIIGGVLGAMLFVFVTTIIIYCFTKKKNKSLDKSTTIKNQGSAVLLGTIPSTVYSDTMNPVYSVTPSTVYSEIVNVTQANDIVYSEVMKVTRDSDLKTVYSTAGFEGKLDAKESTMYSVIGV